MPRATPRSRRTGVFHVESTRLRSNVADQVQRDLLPAGRMLSVFLVLCELLAEIIVLFISRGQSCDRPLRFWVVVLMMLQGGTVILNCLNICRGGDGWGEHRQGLSASEIDLYADNSTGSGGSGVRDVAVNLSREEECEFPTTPLLEGDSSAGGGLGGVSSGSTESSWSSATARPAVSRSQRTTIVSTEFVDRYVRIVNAWYLVWFILGSVWVSDGGTCASTAPHLHRLIVALTIIYYALLFLPLACFCLIVCCLPLFVLGYRVMLPIADRERRRARAADPQQVANLSSIVYTSENFARHTGSENLEDASCVICLCDYEDNEVVRFLPCKHHFHKDCVDEWLRLDKACCLCKQDIDVQAAPLSSAV